MKNYNVRDTTQKDDIEGMSTTELYMVCRGETVEP
jgi:hypothetical protein